MHYVIGDVHGSFKELKLLLDKIETRDPEATIYFVGDWIDRGEQVAEVMQWVVDNITTTGKYRSVRGNHDQEALDWFNERFLPWTKEEHNPCDPLPETLYDFANVVDNCFDRNPDALRPFFNKVESDMPFNVAVEVTTVGGVKMTYRICHAWHSGKGTTHDTNLYERNYWGYHVEGEIIVHGHTPTISHDYILRGFRGEEHPGMIGYRQNDINVDGGCCFQRSYLEYPCMLCAICLETLEEFYSHTLEERFMENAIYRTAQMPKAFMQRVSDEDGVVQAIFEGYLEEYANKIENTNRQKLLEKLGV